MQSISQIQDAYADAQQQYRQSLTVGDPQRTEELRRERDALERKLITFNC